MSFVTLEFVAFFAIVTCVYWALPHRAQNVLLAGAGLVFAGWVHPWFALVLGGTATADYVIARLMVARPAWRKRLLALTIAIAATNLGVFKYLDFGIENVAAVLRLIGLQAHHEPLRLLLPAGLSFWTFQSVGYVVDVYRGHVAPRRNFVDYMVYLAFFPQLVAGPIERAGPFLAQVERPRRFSLLAARSGLALVLFGAVKKVVIADTIAPYVDAVYAYEPAAIAAWAACVAFMVQLLADFSGYADIAVGTARILGFELTKNFNHPYLARTPFDLWDRWHISLSTWLRDYIYLPISNARWARRWLRVPFVRESGLVTQIRAALVTWLFSGIWHGAAWHFVFWGLYWGLVQTVWLVAKRRVPRRWHWIEKSWGMLLVMVPLTAIAHQLWREPDLGDFFGYLVLQPPMASEAGWTGARTNLSLAAVGAGLLCAAMAIEKLVLPRIGPTTLLFLEASWFSIAVFSLVLFHRSGGREFLYFAF